MSNSSYDCDVVLTGAGGFLGSQLLSALVANGRRVLAVTSRSKENVLAMLPVSCGPEMVSVISPELIDHRSESLTGALVLSCAFPRGGNGVQLACGLDFIDHLTSLAVREGAYGFVNVSSQSVYPAFRTKPAREIDGLSLDNTYALAKRAVEILTRSRCEGHIPYTSVRLASLVGPRFDQRVINKMAHNALMEGVIDVSNPHQVFDYMDVRDAVAAFVALSESNPLEWDEVYNLGSDCATSLEDIAELVAIAVRSRGHACAVRVVEHDGESSSSALDALRFRTAFGWKPRYMLKDAIDAIVACMAEGLIEDDQR